MSSEKSLEKGKTTDSEDIVEPATMIFTVWQELGYRTLSQAVAFGGTDTLVPHSTVLDAAKSACETFLDLLILIT